MAAQGLAKYLGRAAYLLLCLALAGLLFWGVMLQDKGRLLFDDKKDGSCNFRDFVMFYAAGKMSGQAESGKSLYDVDLYNQSIKELCLPFEPISRFHFQYPPFFFAALKAVSALDLKRAYFVWSISGLFFEALLIWFMLRGCICSEKVYYILLALSAFPSFSNFYEGQTAAVLLFGFASLFLLSCNRRFFLAGLFSAFAFLKLQYAPALIICGFCLGRRRYLAGAGVGLLILLLVSIISAGFQSLLDYPLSLLNAELSGAGHLDPGGMANLRALLHLCLHLSPKLELLLTILFYLASLVALAFVWLKLYPLWSKRGEPAMELCAAISVLLTLNYGLHVWIYDYISALPVSVYLWLWLEKKPRVESRKWIDPLLRFVLLAFPFLVYPPVLILISRGQGWYFAYLWGSLVCLLVILSAKQKTKEWI